MWWKEFFLVKWKLVPCTTMYCRTYLDHSHHVFNNFGKHMLWFKKNEQVNWFYKICEQEIWVVLNMCVDLFRYIFKNRRTDFNSKTWKYYEQQIWTKKIEHRKRLVTNSRNATLFYRQVKWLELIIEQEMWIDYNMSFDWKVMAYGYDLLFFFEHRMWIKLNKEK